MSEEYKTFEELKEELGNKFEEYMYKANINLLDENRQLKETIKHFHHCPYDDKCGELYDCTKEEYQSMAERNMELSLENTRLRNNWSELKKWLVDTFYMDYYEEDLTSGWVVSIMKEKMRELEENDE